MYGVSHTLCGVSGMQVYHDYLKARIGISIVQHLPLYTYDDIISLPNLRVLSYCLYIFYIIDRLPFLHSVIYIFFKKKAV